ncbi:hypothetical protein CJD36_017760 [Flavipsychrobacter stenotrophus]|uniref:Uncharacterized protein n=1 Tax=Flavipsychrobacter stenotrophus TaxID=2077091 RepID=A0A2S7SSQ9_9BACT|nr:hypothetical protein [Flavipsychrobacter stenotrophus]PQJ09774.1 hypothetical protein CJD36_017760 [Flavipsychrobacter stenotrophus]
MTKADDNYKSFTRAYQTGNFVGVARLVVEILCLLPGWENSLSSSWRVKLSELFQFLHQTGFEFKDEDDFYEILSTISIKMKSQPDIEWKEILT